MKSWKELSHVTRTQILWGISAFVSIAFACTAAALSDTPPECRATPNIYSALLFALSGGSFIVTCIITMYMQKAEVLDMAISETEQRALILKLLNKYDVKYLGEKDIAYAQIVEAIMDSGRFGEETSKNDVKIATLTFIQGYLSAISQSFTWMRERDIESIVKSVRTLDANWITEKPKKEVN